MENETRASGDNQMADNGDMTGNEPLQGTRHLAAESRTGLVDQDKNLQEAIDNGGRSPQADYGTRNDPRREKDAGRAPEDKALGGSPEMATQKTPAKKRGSRGRRG